MGHITEYLTDRSLLKRFMWMCILSFSVFFLTWIVSYLVLPQGILRGKLLGTWLFGEDIDWLSTFVKIFLFNFLIGGIVFSLCNLFRVGNIPLGYVAVWLEMLVFAVLKGTNSFVYPYETMLSSFIGFLRTGLWESSAYILMTCSTFNFAIYRQESWLSGNVTRIKQWQAVKLSKAEKGTYAMGVAILAFSAYLESLAIFNTIP
jgi:hypothetical protein